MGGGIKNILSVWISTGIAVLYGKAVCFPLPLLLTEESYVTASISYATLQRSYVES